MMPLEKAQLNSCFKLADVEVISKQQLPLHPSLALVLGPASDLTENRQGHAEICVLPQCMVWYHEPATTSTGLTLISPEQPVLRLPGTLGPGVGLGGRAMFMLRQQKEGNRRD